uniref:Transferase family protein n=1 Tax=Leersia perrieri TaxID=77586 RepID=A0A0D9XNV3_9ORYZ
MEVQVKRSLVVPPPQCDAEEVPFTVFDLCDAEEVPFTVFDLVAPTYHVTVLFAFSPPNPTIDSLLDALSITLPHFPILTARIEHEHEGRRRHPCFVTGKGGAGALVMEAKVTSSLSDHLPLVPSPELAGLHPLIGSPTEHVLMLQINRFTCGGLVIAASSHHQAADGFSMNIFFNAWTDIIRRDGAPTEIGRPVPYGPGALSPRHPPRCEFEHRGKEFLPRSDGATVARSHEAIDAAVCVVVDPSEINNMMLHYTNEFVAELKRRAQDKYTTFETVTTHVWKKITAARGLAADARTSVNVAVSGRGRLGGTGAVPKEGFLGNLILSASSKATVREVMAGTLADAAAILRTGIRAVDRQYFQSFIDFGALHDDDSEPLEKVAAEYDELGMLSPNIDSDSWLHLELHKLDLGCGGQLAGILPGKIPQDGAVVVMPSLKKDGGVDVFVALWEKHAKEFASIAYTMD